RQSFVSLDAALQARLVADVAAKVDAQLYSDAGDGVTTPRGMFAWEGTQDVAVGGALALDAILDGQAMALAANVDPARLRCSSGPATIWRLGLSRMGISGTCCSRTLHRALRRRCSGCR